MTKPLPSQNKIFNLSARFERVRARFTLAMAACNLARLPKLLAN